jgi:predicted NBD/HSP70 family sugar kinase
MLTYEPDEHSGSGEPASVAPPNLREVGRRRVLQALHGAARTSRPELVRLTGLSRATVSALVADLVKVGLVMEEEVAAGPEERRLGRPAQFLSLVPSAAYAVGLDIGHQHVRVVLCDLTGEPVWNLAVAKDVDHAPAETLDLATALVGRAIRDHQIARERILGIGVGIACPVDTKTGALGDEGIMAGWSGLRLGPELERRTGLATRITNDANAGALAERLYGAARNTQDLVYVRLSAGIGAGIVAGGRLLLGARGLTGEIGHLPTPGGSLVCRCGNRGCLETVASPVAIARLLESSWGRPVLPGDLTGLLREGNRGAVRAIEDAAEAVGRALATVVTLVNPELIVVGGDLAAAGDVLLGPLTAAVRRHALPSAADHITVVAGELGDCAEVRGAASIVLAQAPRTLAGLGDLADAVGPVAAAGR